jgi:hypothetical protein
MHNRPKLFAFKLAEKQESTRASTRSASPAAWKARDGVAVAGCSEVERFQYRYTSTVNSRDTGQFC